MNDIRPRTYVPAPAPAPEIQQDIGEEILPEEYIKEQAAVPAVPQNEAAGPVPEAIRQVPETAKPAPETAKSVQEVPPQPTPAMFDSSNLDLEDLWRDVMEELSLIHI